MKKILKKSKFYNTTTQNITKLKTQNVTTQKLKMWQNFKNSKCDKTKKKSKFDKTKKHKMWQNLKSQIWQN